MTTAAQIEIPIAPPGAADPTAPRRGSDRRHAQRLAELAEHLPATDRLLVEHVYGRGASLTGLSEATGKSRAAMYRRLRSAVNRIRGRRYRFLAEHGLRLAPDARDATRLIVFEGQTLRQAAQATGQSLHQIRTHLQTLDALTRL